MNAVVYRWGTTTRELGKSTSYATAIRYAREASTHPSHHLVSLTQDAQRVGVYVCGVKLKGAITPMRPQTSPENGWLGFLETCDWVSSTRDGKVHFFRRTNCNYILFRGGQLLLNYGFHGRAVMEKIQRWGTAKALQKLQKSLAYLDEVSHA